MSIAKIEIVHTRRAGWPGYKVRHITAGGRVLHAYEYQSYADALAAARRAACKHGAQLVRPIG